MYRCETCNTNFSSTQSLKYHNKNVNCKNNRKTIKCNKCNKLLTQSGMIYHRQIDCLKNLILFQYTHEIECKICGAFFNSKRDFRKHKIDCKRIFKIEVKEVVVHFD